MTLETREELIRSYRAKTISPFDEERLLEELVAIYEARAVVQAGVSTTPEFSDQ